MLKFAEIEELVNSRTTPQELIDKGAMTFESFTDFIAYFDITTGAFFVDPPRRILTKFYPKIKEHVPNLPFAIRIYFPEFNGNPYLTGLEKNG